MRRKGVLNKNPPKKSVYLKKKKKKQREGGERGRGAGGDQKENNNKKIKTGEKKLPTAPGVPRRSPIQVLTGPDVV